MFEQLGFEPSGEGEHLLLHIEKRNQNTRWVAKLLAEALSVGERAIGYCGLKDRRAISRQWFSVHTPDMPEQLDPGTDVSVLSSVRHHKKLRRGMHQGNDFIIRLRNFSGNKGAAEQRLNTITAQGVPNYFGEQRFGIAGGNLQEADKLLVNASDRNRRHRKGKNRRQQKGGIYLSAARSYLFNLVLAQRVCSGSWDKPLEEEGVPQGPLWGRGRSSAPEQVRILEQSVLADWQSWCNGLEFSGLQQERRSLVLRPECFQWQWLGNDLQLSFSLPPGAYATAVLQEIAQLKHPERE